MEKILVLDFGGQYAQLVAKRVRECKVYSEVLPCTTPISEIKNGGYKGVIAVGDVLEDAAAQEDILSLSVPMLGIGSGALALTTALGGKVTSGGAEVGKVTLQLDNTCALLSSLPPKTDCYMHHSDYIKQIPTGFRITAKTDACPVAAMENASRGIFIVQFHPEVSDTPLGRNIFKNFLYGACGCHAEWTTASFVRRSVASLREKIGDRRVLCAISGGASSSVAAMLLHKAVGDKLTCLFVDNGMLRLGEADEIRAAFGSEYSLKLVAIDAKERFFGKLIGISDKEAKNKIINEELVRVFADEAAKLGHFDFIVKNSKNHKVLPLCESLNIGNVVEPLADLFRDEIYSLGLELGLSEELSYRQPFPIAGLAARVSGEVTAEKLSIVREADAIFREEITAARLERSVSRYFASVSENPRDGYTVSLCAQLYDDLGNAVCAPLPFEVLSRCAERISALPEVTNTVYTLKEKENV